MEPHFESIIHTKKIHHDIVVLRKKLLELKGNVGLLYSEALHHQLKLTSDSSDQRILSPRILLDVNEKITYLNMMRNKLKVQQKVSLSGLSEVKVGVKRVAGFLHESEPLSPSKRHKPQQEDETDDSPTEKEVFKLYETEGTIGDAAYAAAFVIKTNPYEEGEKVTDVENLSLGTQSTVVKKMLTPGRVSMPDTVNCFTANLYYHKLLAEERSEALDYLESEVPGVEVVRGTEPVMLQLLSHGQHEVEVQWELIWDDKNTRFKYNILVNCSEEVVTRYSTADIYPYLSRQQKLQTPQDVISLAETFTEL